VVVLVDCLLSSEADGMFKGAILNVHDCSLWSETATKGLFERVRAAASGDARRLEEVPVSFFTEADADDLYYLLLLTILGRWDAMLVPSHGTYVFDLSHHEIVKIIFRHGKAVDEIVGWLEKSEFSVSRDVESGPAGQE
jgi:hypothetical protein